MGLAIIGVDPHKLSATIEVVDEHEKFLDRVGSRPIGLATARCDLRQGVARAGLGGRGR
jgi:hypothetical protein